jgi:ProP effector
MFPRKNRRFINLKADGDVAYAVLALLCERFPKCFVRYHIRRRPLKVGIDKDILAVLDGAVTPDELSKALCVYVMNKTYRARLKAGATRIDLDGNSAGIVTAEQATPSAPRQPKPAQSAPPPSPSAPPSPPAPPSPSKAKRGDSLADLRAAQRRKAQEAAP